MTKEFIMLQSEMDDIIAINKNQPSVMKFGGYWMGMDLQEKINHYWETLGEKYGFKPLTVSGQGSQGKLSFIAEPKEILYCIEISRELDSKMVKHHKFFGAPTRDEVLEFVKGLDINYDHNYGEIKYYPVNG